MKILVVTMEPPPTSSGLGTLWGKLAGSSQDVIFDFYGPAPRRTSPVAESGLEVPGRLYDPGEPPLSRLLAVRRNVSSGIKKLFWSLLYFPFYLIRRFGKSDVYGDWFERKVRADLPSIISAENYAAVLVHVPPFRLAETVRHLAADSRIPFIYAVGDPIGYRDEKGDFYPEQPSVQQMLIESAALFVTTRQTFERYYSKTFAINRDKIVFFSDGFTDVPESSPTCEETRIPVIMHWGRVSPWRPINCFAKALAAFNRSRPADALLLHVVGRIEGRGRQKEVEEVLGEHIRGSRLSGYQKARQLAATADYFVVSVCERHMDNIPSKLIDLFSFRKPMIVLASLNSECAEEVRRLGVGVVVDPEDQPGIEQALTEITDHSAQYRDRYASSELRETWACSSVAGRFASELSRKLISLETSC